MNIENIYAALALGMCIIIAATFIDVNVSINVTDKAIINKLNSGGENRNIALPTGRNN